MNVFFESDMNAIIRKNERGKDKYFRHIPAEKVKVLGIRTNKTHLNFYIYNCYSDINHLLTLSLHTSYFI